MEIGARQPNATKSSHELREELNRYPQYQCRRWKPGPQACTHQPF